MNKLTVLADHDPHTVLETLEDAAAIARCLMPLGIGFEQWPTATNLPSDADATAVMAAYRDCIDACCRRFDFQTVDVAAIHPDHPQAAAMRGKFLAEHTHDDFEARYFVEGSGMFYIHADQRVWMLRCEQGDFINLPAMTPHWFDMGARPDFTAIRFFRLAEGWVAQPSGSDIADRFPRYEVGA